MNKSVQYAWRLYHWLLDLFIPPCCVVCGKVEIWLCESCATELSPLGESICPRCGRPQASARLCPTCRSDPVSLVLRSAFLFEGAVREAVHALKYRGARDIAIPLGKRMAEVWQSTGLQSDLLIPIPLHPKREAKRGYNQATLLAIALGHELGLPVAVDGFQRTRDTASQTRLNRPARRNNVQGAFACLPSLDVSQKRVTLVDDVATTGATMEACAMVLLAHGASTVTGFTLARAP